ncbi:FKBP-type peptidyl-prolyl cis-trans isomerase [Teredinibacter franksiae]|jgi:FKBP-type peptidyl-prolyl cis-trans isomerases 1|uniref:FKBP-type peptidyl-prolyl cis-trans isomerase n=1 Tax=Teredinibacter franksiae TaxID=2761453 RepID=UPI0016293C68|nr:FKBP-type peptidyl-prolyl cis-trans isomerase [Teredinibacter franksiae]
MKDRKKLNKGSAGQNRKTSETFIAKHSQQEGVYSTATGLLYRVLEVAQGIQPTEQDTVVVNQRILNADGSVIADTYKTGMPDKFAMTEAIPGLREGLMMMSPGARYEFVVPPELGWGKRGASNKIGPNAVLIFDVRLLEVVF